MSQVSEWELQGRIKTEITVELPNGQIVTVSAPHVMGTVSVKMTGTYEEIAADHTRSYYAEPEYELELQVDGDFLQPDIGADRIAVRLIEAASDV